MQRIDSSPTPTTSWYWTLWWIFTLKWLKHAIRIAFVILNNFYVIPAHCVWMLLLWPVSVVSKNRYWRIEEYFFGRILGLVACWSYTAGYRIFESGDDLDALHDVENYLFMPNHQSTADVPLCMTIFSARNRYPDRVMWIMDRLFKFTNFGLVAWLHDDFFILAGKENRERSLTELRQHLATVFVQKRRKCLVLFPEGGFLRKRKPASHRFAMKHNLPLLEHCTLPRTGALEVVVEKLGPLPPTSSASASASAQVKADHVGKGVNGSVVAAAAEITNEDRISKVVDVTIAYEGGIPLDLMNIVSALRPPCNTHVHYRVFNMAEIPSESEELRRWMYKLYCEKEEMLKVFYDTGEFPYDMYDGNARPPMELSHDPSRFVIFHLFYILSTCLFWYMSRRYTCPAPPLQQ